MFQGENMQTQYSVSGYTICLYFHKYKLAIEVDGLGHTNRNINNEIERQKVLEKELNCIFIRIKPDEKDFNIFKELKFKTNHSIITKTLKRVVKKTFYQITKNKKVKSKNKRIKKFNNKKLIM